MTPPLYVHEVRRHSRVNGPGKRAVVWVQGCSIGCPGCFNPLTHASDTDGHGLDANALGMELGLLAVDGLTISGGEPMEQPEAVLALIRAFRRVHAGTVLLFTGLPAERLFRDERARRVVLETDALLAGPYVPARDESEIWHHKRLLLVTDRISPDDLLPEKKLELDLDRAGQVHLSGYPGAVERSALTMPMRRGNAHDDQG